MNGNRKWLKRIGLLLLSAYSIMLFLQIAGNSDKYQWDFRIYYYGATAYFSGFNPYDIDNLTEFSGVPISLKFVYPPLSLPVFRLLNIFNFDTAYLIFLILKVICLIFMLILWRRAFAGNGNTLIFYIICLFGFNGAVIIDLMAGNVSIFEQLLLWLAFYFLLKDKPLMFNIFIVLSSFLKFATITFIILNLLMLKERRLPYFTGGLALFGLMIGLNYLYDPVIFASFLENAGGLSERGVINPSTYALVADPFRYLYKTGLAAVPQYAVVILYLAVVIVILGLSWNVIRRLKGTALEGRREMLLYFCCILFALLMPRFKSYSYILLIVPAFHLLSSLKVEAKAGLLALVLVLTIPGRWNLPGTELIVRAFWDYYPLALAYCMWWMYYRFSRGKSEFQFL